MRQEERPKDRVERLKREYGWLYDEALAMLFRHDPMGINFETNPDEYAPEVATILPSLASADSAAHLSEIICEEFEYWFGTASSRIHRSIYNDLAEELWAAYEGMAPGRLNLEPYLI